MVVCFDSLFLGALLPAEVSLSLLGSWSWVCWLFRFFWVFRFVFLKGALIFFFYFFFQIAVFVSKVFPFSRDLLAAELVLSSFFAAWYNFVFACWGGVGEGC